MSGASATSRPRQPERDPLRQGVREQFETFRTRAAAQSDGRGLPRFVERACCNFLTCGALAGGIARFRCGSCGFDRLVAFSCKGRRHLESCMGRPGVQTGVLLIALVGVVSWSRDARATARTAD